MLHFSSLIRCLVVPARGWSGAGHGAGSVVGIRIRAGGPGGSRWRAGPGAEGEAGAGPRPRGAEGGDTGSSTGTAGPGVRPGAGPSSGSGARWSSGGASGAGERDSSRTCLAFPCPPGDGKRPLPPRELRSLSPPTPTFFPDCSRSPSSSASVGCRCSSSTHRLSTWPTGCEAGRLPCTKACFRMNQGRNSGWRKYCIRSGQVPITEATALGEAGGQRSQSPGLSSHTALPRHPALHWALMPARPVQGSAPCHPWPLGLSWESQAW